MRAVRGWLTLATVLFLVPAALAWVLPFGPMRGDAGGVAAAVAATAAAGILFLAASRRRDLVARLRQALLLFGISMLLAAGGNALRLLGALGVHLPTIPHLDITSTVVIWAIGLAALLRLPLMPLARGGWWRLATDTSIAVGGATLAIFAIWALPGLQHAPAAGRLRLLEYDAMEAANLLVLNLILVRGPSRAIRSAYWWLAVTIVIETTYLVAVQYAIGIQSHDFRLPNSLFFVDYLAYVYAGAMFLTRPQPDGDVFLWPEAVRAFNPLPLAAIVGVGVLLILSALRPGDPARVPLAVGTVILALLLFARLVGATGEILRLRQQEAAEERRRSEERQMTLRRLAGGIAHRINNLMTVVLLQAGQMEADDGGDPAGAMISDAAREAAALADRLLLSSGRPPNDQLRRPLAEIVDEQRGAVRRLAGSIEVSWRMDEGAGTANVGAAAVEAVLKELVSNAVEACADCGRIAIRVHDCALSSSPSGMTLAPAPGRYSVLEVSDTGRGIRQDDLARIHEPFYTTRPLHEGRGLGLSVVYGLLAGLGGGLRVESEPGRGAAVSVYLPIRGETARG